MSDKVQNIFFMFGLLAFALSCMIMVATSAGPIVLGSELNTNGRVEYLCLGSGCNGL